MSDWQENCKVHVRMVRSVKPKVTISNSLRSRILRAARKAFHRSHNWHAVQSMIALLIFTAFGIVLAGYYVSTCFDGDASGSTASSQRNSHSSRRTRPTTAAGMTKSIFTNGSDSKMWSQVEKIDNKRLKDLKSLRSTFLR